MLDVSTGILVFWYLSLFWNKIWQHLFQMARNHQPDTNIYIYIYPVCDMLFRSNNEAKRVLEIGSFCGVGTSITWLQVDFVGPNILDAFLKQHQFQHLSIIMFCDQIDNKCRWLLSRFLVKLICSGILDDSPRRSQREKTDKLMTLEQGDASWEFKTHFKDGKEMKRMDMEIWVIEITSGQISLTISQMDWDGQQRQLDGFKYLHSWACTTALHCTLGFSQHFGGIFKGGSQKLGLLLLELPENLVVFVGFVGIGKKDLWRWLKLWAMASHWTANWRSFEMMFKGTWKIFQNHSKSFKILIFKKKQYSWWFWSKSYFPFLRWFAKLTLSWNRRLLSNRIKQLVVQIQSEEYPPKITQEIQKSKNTIQLPKHQKALLFGGLLNMCYFPWTIGWFENLTHILFWLTCIIMVVLMVLNMFYFL